MGQSPENTSLTLCTVSVPCRTKELSLLPASQLTALFCWGSPFVRVQKKTSSNSRCPVARGGLVWLLQQVLSFCFPSLFNFNTSLANSLSLPLPVPNCYRLSARDLLVSITREVFLSYLPFHIHQLIVFLLYLIPYFVVPKSGSFILFLFLYFFLWCVCE